MADETTFDSRSGSVIERLLFSQRTLVMLFCLAATLVLGLAAFHVRLNANFESMIPADHPYIKNYLEHRSQLQGQGNSLRIAVEARQGNILNAQYLDALRRINDEVFLIPGVDRPHMKSLWTANTRWVAATVDGLDGGPVIPGNYAGSERDLKQILINVTRSGEVGHLVSSDFRSSVIEVPLLSFDTQTGKPLDYAQLSTALEHIRSRYDSPAVGLHIVGFAKVMGDMIDSLRAILYFFAAAFGIAAAMLFAYTRCYRSMLVVTCCSLIAVVWQLGLLTLLGHELDPYSILVPFLVFAIGMSHGAQKMNGIMQDIGRGFSPLVAARLTFRRLFIAGLTALLCDAVGFAVLALIDIKVIRDLALIASMGVAILVFSNLILLPVLLSYIGVSESAANRTLRDGAGASQNRLWSALEKCTSRKWATIIVASAVVLGWAGYDVSTHLRIGDLHAGASELRQHSRYNRDVAFITKNYGASTDVFSLMVKTAKNACVQYETLSRVDSFEWRMRQLPGVDSTASLATVSRGMTMGMNEGNPKWFDLSRTQGLLNTMLYQAPPGFFDQDCDLLSVFVYLRDHRADTLASVMQESEKFARENSNDKAKFLLVAGNAGIEAVTNVVVKEANHSMLLWVYAAVICLCLFTFRSWRAVVCAVLPLMLTSTLCEALMVALQIGVKVSTLPVIALGVGIGVDYALYVMSVILVGLRAGRPLREAYRDALQFTGKVVLLTGFTLAAGVATWGFSPIKFQADMGILLAFMFLLNMLGALVLLPALVHFFFPRAVSKTSHGSIPAANAASGR